MKRKSSINDLTTGQFLNALEVLLAMRKQMAKTKGLVSHDILISLASVEQQIKLRMKDTAPHIIDMIYQRYE